MSGVTYGDPTWSLGTLIGMPIGILITALLIVGTVWLRGACRRDDLTSDGEARVFTAIATGITLVALLITAGAMFPYKAEYHQWRPVTGQVEQIDKRLVSSGKSMEDKFVVRFAGTDRQYGCLDTRCASVRPGDLLTITCKRAWQYAGVSGYDCNFVSVEPGAAS